jgi:hypothetical protein
MHYFQKNEITMNSINAKFWEPQQVRLYAQIQAFEIDQPFAALPFSKRLARDHQWSLIYTERVIEEYKKFLFLAIVADHPVTPSNAVDQAWHLHLTYTHSYWNELCSQVLPKPLHHHPTQGGQQQRELFWECYCKTLDSYECFFGHSAPIDIWPDPADRFRQAGQFRQINSADYWMIPKPSFTLPKQVFLNISRHFWLHVVVTASLVFGFGLSLDFLDPSVIAVDLDLINSDLINNRIIQSVLAQVSSTSNSDAPTYSEVNLTQNFGWIKHFFDWVIIAFFNWVKLIVFCGIVWLPLSIIGLISMWIDSRCPACKRFGLVEIKTQVLLRPTEEVEGKELVTKCCKFCSYTHEQLKTIPREPDSNAGCGCGGCGI